VRDDAGDVRTLREDLVAVASPTEQPWVASSIDELLAGASERQAVRSSDAKSGAVFERLAIDGERCFLKVLSADADWIMRVTGNTTHWELQVWRAGLYHRTPAVIDHAMIGMALDGEGSAARLAMLMHDRGDCLVPPGDDPLPMGQHLAFLEHLAAMHASFLGFRDDLGLCRMDRRLRFFAPATIEPELAVDDVPGPVAIADVGWRRLPALAPRLDALVRLLHDDPYPLIDELAATPATFVAGDWKLGNLGSRPDGRSVVLDWAYPGEAPPCWELAWYLALNRARLPQSKEASIAAYRAALEHHGVDTADWFERQLGLSLAAMMAAMAWEKAVGDADELAWWEAAALDGITWLG
jgi:hypothetical protein